MLARLTTSAGLAVALMMAPALGQAGSESAEGGIKDRFAEIDANGDGQISRDEWTSREKMVENPPNFFVANMDADLNEDDQLSKEEWDNYFAKQ